MEEIGKYIWVQNSHDQYDYIPGIQLKYKKYQERLSK